MLDCFLGSGIVFKIGYMMAERSMKRNVSA